MGDAGSEVLKSQEAIARAKEKGLDLVEIVPDAKPPVCKIVDYKKFLYEEKRKKSGSAKKGRVKKQETKEFRFGPYISENDLQIRINRSLEFLELGDKVKVTVQFHGREITHPEFGQEKIAKFIKAVEEKGEVENPPERRGMYLSALIKPRK